MRELERRTGKGFGAVEQPAAGLGAQRRARLDAGHDGHDPQPRPQRRDGAGPGAADRQRALRLGRVPPLHRDVLRPSCWASRRTHFEHVVEERQAESSASRPIPSSTADRWQELVAQFQEIVREHTGKRDFPQDVREQLDLAIEAVFDSWNSKRAIDYRRYNKISDDWGTAVNVVSMVFGNMGDDSGTGVAFTRDPNTGEKHALRRVPAQRAGRGRRRRHPHAEKIADLATQQPEVYGQFVDDRGPARAALPRHAGPGVHRRARQALHAADAQRQAQRRGRGARSRSTWSTKA